MEKIIKMAHAKGWTPYRNNKGDWVWQMPDDNSPHDLEWPGIKPPSPDCIPVWKGDGWYWSQPIQRAADAMPCGHPKSAVVSSGDGTNYCGLCEAA